MPKGGLVSYLIDRAFWGALIERAVKTFAQAAVAAIVATNVVSIVDLDGGQIAGVAGLATLLSVLTSIASGAVGGDGPSLTRSETLTESPPEHATEGPGL